METTTDTTTSALERSGESWEALMRRHRIRNITDRGAGRYDVESTSGHTYRVECYTPRNPEAALFCWRCDCPARKTCRHIEAVVNMRWAEAAADEDYDGMDVMEREEF